MDIEKEKYLEELRKELDPEVLLKIMNHLGGEKNGGGNVTQVSGSSAAELIKQRRALRFRERIARKKMENHHHDALQTKEKNSEFERRVLILSSTDIWSRIVDSQFKALGFTHSENFTEFSSLIRYIVEGHNNGTLGLFAVAVALQEIGSFLYGWESLRRGNGEQKRVTFLDEIPYFLVVESPRQVQNQLVTKFGAEHIICLTDDPEVNREKVENAMTNYKPNNERGEQ